MKKLVLTLAIVFVGIISANAQVWVGGGLNANIHKGYTKVGVAPEVGYMIPNTPFTLALGMGYTFENTKGLSTTHELAFQPYFRYVPCTIGKKFSLFLDLTGDFALVDSPLKGSYAVMLQPGIAWMATDKWTAAFRFGMMGYDHGFYGTNGFLMKCDLAAPSIRLYYNF